MLNFKKVKQQFVMPLQLWKYDQWGDNSGWVMIMITSAEVCVVSVLPRYGVKTNKEAFHAQFELLTQAGWWSSAEKVLQLVMCLKGGALPGLLLLSLDDRSDHAGQVGAFKRRFGLYAQQLACFAMSFEEQVRDLVNDVDSLVHCA